MDWLFCIADLIRQHSTKSPEVILKLSGLLSYILYENEEKLIPLEKELRMVKDYLQLEKTFYHNRIAISMKNSGDLAGKTIAPFILLSLVQNCCEQFLISLQQKLAIEIESIAEDNKFIFRLSCNGYYENIHGIGSQNTRLNQALRRIQEIYPGKHQLETNSQNGLFSMMLVLEADNVLIHFPKESERKKIV